MPSPTTHGKGLDIPANGVEFELTLTEVPDPMEMVRGNGYDPANWKYNGQRVTPRTACFKLVWLGYCRNLDEVKQQAGAVEGQWREAFKRAFPKNDGKGPIGFADDSWVAPGGRVLFPVLLERDEGWLGHFYWAGCDYDGSFRWLVPCDK